MTAFTGFAHNTRMAENSDITAKRHGRGRPFQKGQSGNPGGRPKVAPEVRELAKEHGPQAFARVIKLMDSKDESLALAACKEVLNRVYGRSPQPLVGGDKPIEIETTPLDDRELARRIALILSRADPKKE